MTRDQLEHAIRAACSVADDVEIWVFGSQSILGSFPTPPAPLAASIVVDVQPKNNPKAADSVEGSLGELSMFHSTHGFYVRCMPVGDVTLPPGWEGRAVPVVARLGGREFIGWCLEPLDLAVSKLAANRPKDREFVRTLIAQGMISSDLLLRRLGATALDEADRSRISAWVRITVEDL